MLDEVSLFDAAIGGACDAIGDHWGGPRLTSVDGVTYLCTITVQPIGASRRGRIMNDHSQSVAADVDGTGHVIIDGGCLPWGTGPRLDIARLHAVAVRAVVAVIVAHAGGRFVAAVVDRTEFGFDAARVNGEVLAFTGLVDAHVFGALNLIVAVHGATT